ncbi:MAG: NOP5/NOP56 family protein [Candidatus Woesearchaeota archaeon]
MYKFRSILGWIAIDGDIRFVEKEPDSEELPVKEYKRVLSFLRSYPEKLHEANLVETKRDIKASVGDDLLVIQCIRSIEDLTRVSNGLVSRLREWYELYNPEFSKRVDSHEAFVKDILESERDELLSRFGITETMGADLPEDDISIMMSLAGRIKGLYEERIVLEKYIQGKMNALCPNVLTLTGPHIGAKLLELAGSLKHLSELPASTVQLLGAEKALFRHIRQGSKCPKYGVLLQHQFVASAEHKGKAARALADKISIASKVDYFGGEFIGDKLKEKLEKRFK